jgi:hypothetical protein
LAGISLFFSTPSIPANPYYVPDLSVGSLWNNNTYIAMPFAEVDIRIDYLGDATFEIAMKGNFTIRTNTTQEYALAFAYPASWTEGLSYNEEELFNVNLDGNSIPTYPLHFTNASWITIWEETKLYHMACYPDYVGFNLSLEADKNHSLVVESTFTKITTYLNLGYVCATALSFKESTRERVTVDVYLAKSLKLVSFSPSNNRTIINETLHASATWDLYYPEPRPYDGSYFPVDGINVFLECFENTTLPLTTTTNSTTTGVTNETTTPTILGPLAISGILGVSFCVATIVFWKLKKM